MTNTEIQAALDANGFPCKVDGVVGPATKLAVGKFQACFNGPGGWLAVDGVPGPKTQAALEQLPHLSAHFVVAEVACHHCGHAYGRRELLAALEKLRDWVGPIRLEDAYRCPEHNAAVGGASDSMHLYGLACDPNNLTAPVATVAAFHLFSGIGDKNGVIKHLDCRHLSPNNLTPNATVANPARWQY